MSNEELIVFTHVDMDALGCMLNIEFKMPHVRKKYFHTNYGNIEKITDQILDHIKENGNKHVLITDVSFSDNKESLIRLYKSAKCTLIDHHLYPDDFWDEFPDMKVHWDKSKSATLLTNEFFGNAGKNKNLDTLTNIIDTYDIWQTEKPLFKFSMDLNDYFWTYDIGLLTQMIVQNNFNLPHDFKQSIDNIKSKRDEDIRDYENRNLIRRSNGITLVFADDWFQHINVNEMENGADVVIGVSSFGIIRIRINKNSKISPEQKNKIRLELTGTENTGHMDAFTYKAPKSSFNEIMNEVQKVVQVFSNVLNVK